MAKIHISLQEKGGVGKSFISATTAQYKHHKGQPSAVCPINSTFHSFKAFHVDHIQVSGDVLLTCQIIIDV